MDLTDYGDKLLKQQNPRQSTRKIAGKSNTLHSTVSRHLKKLGKVSKLGVSILNRIVTGEKKLEGGLIRINHLYQIQKQKCMTNRFYCVELNGKRPAFANRPIARATQEINLELIGSIIHIYLTHLSFLQQKTTFSILCKIFWKNKNPSNLMSKSIRLSKTPSSPKPTTFYKDRIDNNDNKLKVLISHTMFQFQDSLNFAKFWICVSKNWRTFKTIFRVILNLN